MKYNAGKTYDYCHYCLPSQLFLSPYSKDTLFLVSLTHTNNHTHVTRTTATVMVIVRAA